MYRATFAWVAIATLALAEPLRANSASLQQNAGAVSGTVVGGRGGGAAVPLPGATVAVDGTSRAVTTNNAGRFRIDGLTGDQVTLRVTVLGFRPLTHVARVGSEGIRITLEELPLTIDRVVVTGQPGATQKRAIGNSVATIDAAAVTETQPISNVGNLLQGRAAGVAVSEQAGVAGGGSRILLRGPGSLTFDGNPIVYVDGVRINSAPSTGPTFGQAGGAGAPSVVSRLNDINPQDIESIEIIRGPAAATLYGTQASAGVIQIITKKGRAGPMRFTAEMRQGASWFNDAENRLPVTYGRVTSTNEIVSTNFVREEADAGRPLFRTGHLQRYNVGISGGADVAQYYSSIDVQSDEGVVPSNDSKHFNGRMNLSLRPNPRFDSDIGLGLMRGDTKLFHALYFGSFVYGQPAFRSTPTRGFLIAPAEVWRDVYDYTQGLNRYQASITLNHRPLSWLSHRLSAGQDYTNQELEVLIPVVSGEYSQFFSPTAARGSKNVDEVATTNTTADYSATANVRLRPRLGSSTSVGGQYYRTFLKAQSLTGTEFPAPGVITISGAAIRSAGESMVEDVTVGLYVQQQFSWNDRIFLTGAVRADDNSAFGADFDLVTYPKVSASWVISEEPFFTVPYLDALKLRAAYGESGQQPASFAAIRTYAPVAGEGDLPAGTPQSPGNPDLGPERGREVEIGFEANALNNRLGIDFTYYDRKNSDVILSRSTAPSTGFSGTQFINAGAISNKGFEAMLRGRPVSRENVSWDLSLNLSKNRNRVVDLGIDAAFIPTGWIPNRQQEGFPVSSYFRKKVLSADIVNGRATNAMCDGGTGFQGVEPGGAAVPCASAPYLYLGKPFFDWNGSINSTLNLFSRVAVGAVLDFRRGGEMFESLRYWNCASLLNHEIVFYPDRFSPAEVAECQLGLDYVGTTRIQDASFTKLREISVQYQVPERFAQRLRAQRASVTLAARNLHTWTGYDGLDPETFTSVNWLLSNHTELVLPLPRTVMATVNFAF